MPTHDDLSSFLNQHRVPYSERVVQNGTQFDCRDGEKITVYDSGKVVVRGKTDTQLAADVARWAGGGDPARPALSKEVFVV